MNVTGCFQIGAPMKRGWGGLIRRATNCQTSQAFWHTICAGMR